MLDTNDYDSRSNPGSAHGPSPSGTTSVVVRLTPQNGALPLNGLFLPDGTTLRREMETPWERLWEEVKRPELAAGMLDFLDTDRTPRPGGSEDEAFINRAPSVLDEIRLYPGIDETCITETMRKPSAGLERYLTVHSAGKIKT